MRPDKLVPILLGIALTIVGIGIPLAFGYAVHFVSDVDVNVLLDDLANVTNHSVIIASKAANEWGNLEVTSDGEYNIVTINNSGYLGVWTWFDKDQASSIDKIVISVNIFDWGAAPKDNVWINYQLWTYDPVREDVVVHYVKQERITTNLSKYEIIITPDTKLKLIYGESMPEYNNSFALHFEIFSDSLDNAVIGYNVKIYKCSHLNSDLIMNGMLAGSGFIMLIFAWAATPFWNPTTRRRRW